MNVSVRKSVNCTFFTLLLAALTQTAFAANLIVDSGGQLTGATGVDVNGTLYNVEFLDGTCVDLFSGCDALSDFTFGGDSASAVDAAQALLDQVFIDSMLGAFDSDPTLTRGCSDPESCSVAFPFSLFSGFVSSSQTTNFSAASGFPDVQSNGSTFIDPTQDWTLRADSTFARFTAVPLPASGLLFFAAVTGLGAFRRRQTG